MCFCGVQLARWKGHYPPIKIISRGKFCIPHGVAMSDELAAVIASRKAQRWAPHKETRALSDIIADLAGDSAGIASMTLPNDWIVRPVARDELRLVSPTTHTQQWCAFIAMVGLSHASKNSQAVYTRISTRYHTSCCASTKGLSFWRHVISCFLLVSLSTLASICSIELSTMSRSRRRGRAVGCSRERCSSLPTCSH